MNVKGTTETGTKTSSNIATDQIVRPSRPGSVLPTIKLLPEKTSDNNPTLNARS